MKPFLIFLLFILPVSIFSQQYINLNLLLNKGDIYLIERQINSVTTQDVMGEIQIIKKTDSLSYEIEVIEQASDSTYYIKIAYKKYKTVIDIKDEITSFDTDSISPDEKNPLENLYLNLIDNDLYFLISNKAKQIRSDSLDRFYRSFESAALSDPEILNSFKDMFDRNTLNALIPLIPFSEKRIALNESWMFPDTSKMGILKLINKTYTLNTIKDDSYYITVFSDIETEKNKALPSNNIFLFYDMTGTMQGTELYDSQSCMLIHSEISHTSNGEVSMKYVENSEPAYIWPIKIINQIKTTVTKIKNNEN